MLSRQKRFRSRCLPFFTAALLFLPPAVHAQEPQHPLSVSPAPSPGRMQVLIRNGLDSLYNLDFPAANTRFRELIAEFPEHPIGYYALTTSLWWELANEHDERNEAVEREFMETVDRTVETAKKMIKAGDPRGEAHLCLGGALGFKSRWEAIQGHWIRAYRNGKAAYNAQREAIELNPQQYDAYLGVGIYHYYTDTLPKVIKLLARFVAKGDRERGLREIRLSMTNGEFSRTAARLFLIGIYNNQEKDPAAALALVREGRVEYPQSSFFHFLEMLTMDKAGMWTELRNEAERYLERIDRGEPSFRPGYIHRGRFFLGNSFLGEGNCAEALKIYSDAIEKYQNRDRWMTWIYLNRGRAFDCLGERKNALNDYRTVLSRRDVWGLHDQAKELIDHPYQPTGKTTAP